MYGCIYGCLFDIEILVQGYDQDPAVAWTRTSIPRTSALWSSQYIDWIMSAAVYPVTFFWSDVFVDEIFGILRGVWKVGNHNTVSSEHTEMKYTCRIQPVCILFTGFHKSN